MKWRMPFDGQTRIVKRFALFPIRLQGECRWLEMCYIEQKYIYYEDMWFDSRFVTKEEK